MQYQRKKHALDQGAALQNNAIPWLPGQATDRRAVIVPHLPAIPRAPVDSSRRVRWLICIQMISFEENDRNILKSSFGLSIG
jgi:hypothetical protein